MPTILDVARHAGVSMKTVSRVLNREAHVRAEVRARVEASVRDLGYRPNLAARALAGQRSFVIAYPFNNPSPSYIMDTMMGAARACRERGYHLVSEPVEIDAHALQTIDRLIQTLRPDGLILTPPLSDLAFVAEHVAALGVPMVRIAGNPMLPGQSIVIDDRAVSRAMVDHLVALRHRRIAFIRPPPEHFLAQARYDGYLDGLAAAGLAVNEQLIRPGAFDVESGADAANVLLDLPEPPSAIFASNDEMALGALQVAHRRGLAIPMTLAIAGFDDSPASRLAYPALTTVRQPTGDLAAGAVAMLLDSAAGTDVRHELVARASTLGDGHDGVPDDRTQ